MTKKFTVHQGDVLLVKIGDKKPTGKAKVNGRVVLALGEVTGHAHVVEGAVAEFVGPNNERMLWVEAPTTVTHEEHNFEKVTGVIGILPVENGLYEIVQQFDEWTRRNVSD